MPLLLVAVVAILWTWFFWARSAVVSPAGLFALISFVVAFLIAILPLGWTPLGWEAALIWVGALTLFSGFHAFSFGWARGRFTHGQGWISSDAKYSEKRYALLVVLCASMQLVGLLAYRGGIEAVVGGAFENTSLIERRWAEGSLRSVGVQGLFFAVSPFLSFLGVLGGVMFRKLWFLASAFALFAAGNTPGRTQLLVTLMTMGFTWIYLQSGKANRKRYSRVKLVAIAVSLALIAYIYFVYVGTELQKIDAIDADSWLPEQLQSLALYLLGGPVALSVALQENLNPVLGAEGRSVYFFIRLASLLDPDVVPPETNTAYVFIPTATNAYTGFGEAWFDGGAAAVVFVFMSYGILSGLAFAGVKRGSLPGIWVASYLAALVCGIFVAGHLFDIPPMLWGLIGGISLSWLQRSEALPVDSGNAQPVPTPRGSARSPR